MTFDHLAKDYDTVFTQDPIAAWLRQRVWARLDALFQPPMQVLELGCGTGEDAAYLMSRGVHVTATDASLKMLHQAQHKNPDLHTHPFDFNNTDTWNLSGQFEGVYSNFGALNCTNQWASLAEYLASITTPQAKLGFGIMGRICLWETLWHASHLEFKTATRRWKGYHLAHLSDATPLMIYYPSPQMITSIFAPYFRVTNLIGLGVALPHTEAYDVVTKRPTLQRWLTHLEISLAERKIWRAIGDHYWIELERYT